MTDVILELSKINMNFGAVQALKDMSLSIRKGKVHALLGENGAGKSTLMKILAGVYQPTNGHIKLRGQSVFIKNPQHSKNLGISIVFQELSLSNNITVAANIYANHEPVRFGIINDEKLLADCRSLLSEFNVPLDPEELVGNISIAKRQLVEIVKALSYSAEVLILDEPTSSLSDNEANILFDIIIKLKERGCAIVYISHRMDEIMRISDDISVIRDGEYVATYTKENANIQQLISHMVGREIKNIFPQRNYEKSRYNDPPRFEARDLTHQGLFHNVNFKVFPGEIFGFFGLIGSGRTDVLKFLFGILPGCGEILIDGQLVEINNPKQAIDRGLAFVTENRKEEGLVLQHDVNMNTHHVAFQYHSSSFGLLRQKYEVERTLKAISQMHTKVKNIYQATGTLSGGNQQKVVLSKWLERTPKILLLDEPTRGVDVGARYEIYDVIQQLAETGTSIILVSSELPEVIGMSDRLAVMRNKEIVNVYTCEGLSQKTVMSAATGAK